MTNEKSNSSNSLDQFQRKLLPQKNSLIYKTSKKTPEGQLFVEIRLDDECKNGHQDFAITGDLYETGKPKTDRYLLACGCIHEEITKYFPEFKQFIALHLCDWEGVPMHAGANGFYHLETGFNEIKPTEKGFEEKFCEYYRLTTEQFVTLKTAQNELQFSLMLKSLGVLKQWKIEAKKAIKKLEKLTGETFVMDSKRSNFVEPTKEAIKEEKAKQESGFYTQAAIEARAQAKAEKEIEAMKLEAAQRIKDINEELDIKIQLFKLGGKHFEENCIFYKHTRELKLNWRDYGEKLSGEECNLIAQSLKLPEGSFLTF